MVGEGAWIKKALSWPSSSLIPYCFSRVLACKTASLNITTNPMLAFLALGNHSLTQYPDFHHALIEGKPATEVINDLQWLQNDFIQVVQKRGQQVMEARKNSSVMSAANATKE